MIVSTTSASCGEVRKSYWVVDFHPEEPANYGSVNSSFRGEAVVVQDLDYHHPFHIHYKTSPAPESQVIKLTDDSEVLSIIQGYVDM
jgi:hypothetical protein